MPVIDKLLHYQVIRQFNACWIRTSPGHAIQFKWFLKEEEIHIMSWNLFIYYGFIQRKQGTIRTNRHIIYII